MVRAIASLFGGGGLSHRIGGENLELRSNALNEPRTLEHRPDMLRPREYGRMIDGLQVDGLQKAAIVA